MRHNAQPSAPGRTDQTRQRQTSPPRIGHVTHEPFEGLPTGSGERRGREVGGAGGGDAGGSGEAGRGRGIWRVATGAGVSAVQGGLQGAGHAPLRAQLLLAVHPKVSTPAARLCTPSRGASLAQTWLPRPRGHGAEAPWALPVASPAARSRAPRSSANAHTCTRARTCQVDAAAAVLSGVPGELRGERPAQEHHSAAAH